MMLQAGGEDAGNHEAELIEVVRMRSGPYRSRVISGGTCK